MAYNRNPALWVHGCNVNAHIEIHQDRVKENHGKASDNKEMDSPVIVFQSCVFKVIDNIDVPWFPLKRFSTVISIKENIGRSGLK